MCAQSSAPRQYPSTYEGPFIVYAENQTDFIDSIAVTKQIRLEFGESFLKSVQMDQRHLKIFMYDRESANELAGTTVCGHTVRLYIPHSLVEVVGVAYINPDISSNALSNLRSFEKSFVSQFSGPRILDCRRLGKTSESWKVLVTFEGQKLPSHVELDQCLFPVSRYYVPMPICNNCLQYGHDGSQCDEPRRCEKCSQPHDFQLEYDKCEKLLCLHCGGVHAAFDSKCEVFARKARENEVRQRKEYDTNYEEWCCFAKQAGKDVGPTRSSGAESDSDYYDDQSDYKYYHSPAQSRSADYNLDQRYDVFISYRRDNGSQLASLIKISLEKRGYSVFLDVEGLNAGEIGSNIKQSIKQAKFFLLILTKCALKLCMGDDKGKDWVHREVVIALNASCKIIPILIDGFIWPTPDQLPADMKKICQYNGVKWVHEYQEACVDRLDRFMSGNSTTLSPGSSRLRLNVANRSSPARSAGQSSGSRRIVRRRSKSYSDLTTLREATLMDRYLSTQDNLCFSHQIACQIPAQSEPSKTFFTKVVKKIKRLSLKK